MAIISTNNASVAALRDVTKEMLAAARSNLGDLLYRRARHVVSENERVLEAFGRMQAGDLETLGQLISLSHASQRDDFEISCDPVDQLVAIADACGGALGARQVGGGFGGCVLCLTTDEHLDAVQDEIIVEYTKASGAKPWVHVVAATDPAGPVVNS